MPGIQFLGHGRSKLQREIDNRTVEVRPLYGEGPTWVFRVVRPHPQARMQQAMGYAKGRRHMWIVPWPSQDLLARFPGEDTEVFVRGRLDKAAKVFHVGEVVGREEWDAS